MLAHELDNLERQLKQGKLTGKAALAALPALLRILNRRTKVMETAIAFVDGVSEEDRLYVKAWDVWRRKVLAAGVPSWVRANAPTDKEPADATEEEPG